MLWIISFHFNAVNQHWKSTSEHDYSYININCCWWPLENHLTRLVDGWQSQHATNYRIFAGYAGKTRSTTGGRIFTNRTQYFFCCDVAASGRTDVDSAMINDFTDLLLYGRKFPHWNKLFVFLFWLGFFIRVFPMSIQFRPNNFLIFAFLASTLSFHFYFQFSVPKFELRSLQFFSWNIRLIVANGRRLLGIHSHLQRSWLCR